ncbi:MAG: tetratricopeptide repeat protein [Dehalococcoidales bacterium]|nr:tetratricopeptide repeat protein [Dehalococcoidales bacterium]
MQSELAESDAFFESHGISKEMTTQDPEGTRQRFRQYLEECVNQNPFNKVWVYHLLAMLYYAEGKLEETAALCSRAASEHPTDPRAWYYLGTIYYGISQATETSKVLDSADVQDFPSEIRERIRRIHHFQKENQQLVQAFRESKLTSPEEATKLALKYFRKTLVCNISNEDKSRVQTHIRIIEARQSSL